MRRYTTATSEYLAGASNLGVAAIGTFGALEAFSKSIEGLAEGKIVQGIGLLALSGGPVLLTMVTGGNAGTHFGRAPYAEARAKAQDDLHRLARRAYDSSPNTWGLPHDLWPHE